MKLGISRAVHEICPQFLHQTGGRGIYLYKQNLPQTHPRYYGNRPVTMVTKIS